MRISREWGRRGKRKIRRIRMRRIGIMPATPPVPVSEP